MRNRSILLHDDDLDELGRRFGFLLAKKPAPKNACLSADRQRHTYDLGGATHKEVAREMGLSLQSVYKIEKRALDKLRAAFGTDVELWLRG